LKQSLLDLTCLYLHLLGGLECEVVE